MKKDTKIFLLLAVLVGTIFSVGWSIQERHLDFWPMLFFVGFPNLVILIASIVTRKNQW